MEKAMKEFMIKVLPGGDVLFIYNDDTPLLDMDMGPANMQRASTVEWDIQGQYWCIWVTDPATGKKTFCPKTFKKRADAIEYEVFMLTELLADGFPAERLFEYRP